MCSLCYCLAFNPILPMFAAASASAAPAASDGGVDADGPAADRSAALNTSAFELSQVEGDNSTKRVRVSV